MFTRKVRISFVGLAILATVLSSTFVVNSASAQLLRRRIRQALDARMPDPPYQVGPQSAQPLLDGPLIRGDGRFLERAQKAIGLFTDGGAELKPVIVISLASFDEFKRVVQLVAQEIRLAHGSEEEPRVLNDFLGLYERIVSRGFDTRQPIGLILQTDGLLYYPLVFTPMNLESDFGRNLLQNYATQLPDGRYQLRQDLVNWPLGRLYLQQHNGWAFIATESQLNALPDDPTVLLQGLDKEHLIAARFDLGNLPSLSTRAALSLGEMQAVAQVETNIEKAMARLGIGYVRSLAEQADFLEYTVSYDEEQNDYVIRQRETVKPGTERARLLRQRRDAVSPFHGFYRPEGAMLASHFVMDLTQHQREQLEIVLDEALGEHLLTEEERQRLKPQPVAENRSRRRRTPRQTETVGPTLAPTEPTTMETVPETAPEAPVESPDPRDRLAHLLSQVPAEEIEKQFQVEPPPMSAETTDLPEIRFSEAPPGERTDSKNLEIVLRKISVCYYWALIGAVRSGKFDGATTCSLEQGFLAAYNIVEGEEFLAAFDSVFEEFKNQFPELYARSVRKDYVELEGFRLTSVSFRPRDFFETAPWGKLIPPDWADRETRIVLGVRGDAVCLAIGEADAPENRLLDAIAVTDQALSVHDMFFWLSPYEIGQAIALSGDPNRFAALKMMAGAGCPEARAYAVSEFTDTSKTLTLRINGLMTPSIWRLRENLRGAGVPAK